MGKAEHTSAAFCCICLTLQQQPQHQQHQQHQQRPVQRLRCPSPVLLKCRARGGAGLWVFLCVLVPSCCYRLSVLMTTPQVRKSLILGGSGQDVTAFVSVGLGSSCNDTTLSTCIILSPPVPCSLDTLHALGLLPPPPPSPPPAAPGAQTSSSSAVTWGDLVIRE